MIKEKNTVLNRWDSDAFKNKEVAIKISKDLKEKLRIFPHPFDGWRSEPNQKMNTLTINENGFRSKSLLNLKFEKNAVLLGGSTAWGFGASSNEFTPAYLIEDFLDKKYNIQLNIINLSDQMFSSFEEMSTFKNNVNQLKPKLIIFISGSNDINREITGSYKINRLYEKVIKFSLWGQRIGIIDEKNYFKRIIKHLVRGFKKEKPIPENFYVPKKPETNKISQTLMMEKIDLVNSYCKTKKIKCAHFLQPDLHFKKNKSEYEKNYIKTNFNKEESKFIIEKFNLFEENFFKKKDEDIFFDSLLNIYNDETASVFFDRAHVSDAGFIKMSEYISQKIAKNCF